MVTSKDPIGISWKHNDIDGIRFKENDKGDMELMAWPDSLPYPTQDDIDGWEREHATFKANQPEELGLNELLELLREKGVI